MTTVLDPTSKRPVLLKQLPPDTIVLLRVGDFYELHGDDAELASELLGWSLTRRGSVAMMGFPREVLEPALKILLDAGHHVAICEPVKSK